MPCDQIVKPRFVLISLYDYEDLYSGVWRRVCSGGADVLEELTTSTVMIGEQASGGGTLRLQVSLGSGENISQSECSSGTTQNLPFGVILRSSSKM